jgi:hypothetical protein
MTVEVEEELTNWRRRADARLSTLEKVSDEHGGKIAHQQGAFAAIHKDLGEIRGQLLKQDGMIQALHLTQSEHNTALRELRGDVTELRGDVTELRRDVTELRGDMTEVRVGIRTIVDLIGDIAGGETLARGQQEGQKREG